MIEFEFFDKHSHFEKRYWNILRKFQEINKHKVSEIWEYHHIFPKSLYPDYETESWNLIKLTTRQHYIVHWVLAKIFNGTMWFAFNMMSRTLNGRSSKLYELSRKYVVEQSSKLNFGRVHSQEFRKIVSERTLGSVTVKNKEGDTFRVSVNDPRYLSGELVYYRTGYTHKQETISKMKESSFYKGKILVNDGENHFFIDKEESKFYTDLGVGFVDDRVSRLMKVIHTNTKFYHNPETKEMIRIKSGDSPPEGYVKGKVKSCVLGGLSVMNRPDYVKMWNLMTRKFSLKHRNEQDYYDLIYPNNGKIIVWLGHIFEQPIFQQLFPEITFNGKTNIVPPPHPNHSKEKFEFCRIWKFTNIGDLGIIKLRLDEFEMDPNIDYIVVKKENYSEFGRNVFTRIIRNEGIL